MGLIQPASKGLKISQGGFTIIGGVGGVALTGGAGAGIAGAWAQLSAAIAADSYLMGILNSRVGQAGQYTLVEIGIGAAASEVSIASFYCGSVTGAPGADPGEHLLPFPMFIASGVRVAARLTTSGSADTISTRALLAPTANLSAIT